MAQYYQVTSLEELHKLYPNLQLDSLEGVSCMVQDDQVTQYTDSQGQQVIATIEQTGVQLAQNLGSSQQCSSQQSQFVVHQPTQYVIQQMDTNETQTSAVQYVQQRAQATESKDEISVVQFKDKVLNCVEADIGSEEHSLQQCIVKPDGSQQYLPQVQSVLQQPIQIHQQIQAVDVGGNILVLQNKEQQDLFINQSKTQELLCSSPEKQHQQQTQHILIQRHQQPKPQQIVTQKQIVHKDENSEEGAQILQSTSSIQSGGQQQQIIHQLNQQSPQQVIQPLQYFNQVTVIDGFSPSRVTIEHHPVSNENLTQQQIQPQIQQFRNKKNIQQTVIQQPHVLVPHTFELASPPAVCSSTPQSKKISSHQDNDSPTAPVFIVQKVDSPFLVRQPQTKFRFQSPQSGNEKLNENSYQTISSQGDQHIVEHIMPDGHHIIPTSSVSSQQTEAQQKITLPEEYLQSSVTPDRSLNYSQVKLGIIEKPFENRSIEQKLKAPTPLSSRTQMARTRTIEQQSESTEANDGKEANVQSLQKFLSNSESPLRPISGPLSQMQSQVDFHSYIQMHTRGRGIRSLSPRGYQYVPRGRGVQVQTSPPRLPNADRGGLNKRLKSPRARIPRGGMWVPGPTQRQIPVVRQGAPTTPNTGPKGETSQSINENVEEARMVVLLINGEKKIVKIPCSQNILLGQLLQQAGLSLTTATPVTIEQVVDDSSDEFGVKSIPANNQQTAVGIKSASPAQMANVLNPTGTPRSIIATIQQRPRIQSPQIPQTSNLGIVKHRLHFASPRMPSPDCLGSSKLISNIVTETTAQQQNAQNSTPTPTPPKEESRFVSGFMAICPFCGISSLDFNKCIRCRRKLPENVKSQSIFSVKKKKEKASGGSEKNEDSKSENENKQLDFSESEGKEKNSNFQGSDKKKSKPCIKKKKISDEPAEILILSSDEEDETKFKKADACNVSTLTVLKKEPVYSDTLTETEMVNLLKENSLNEDLMRNVPPGSFTVLQCRTVRIGSYKVQPKERIFLSSRGFKIVINSLKSEIVTIIIPATDIIKILIHFGKQIPVIFIYPTPKIGAHIRELLGMDNKRGPYYDPTSTKEETHKRITLLLEKISEDSKIVIKKIFGQEKLDELSEKEANEILIRASPVEVQSTGIKTDNVRKIMVYPPPPEKGGITLNNQDYACLGEDQFLNDVIIDFYLKYLLLKVLSPADRNRTHVFSTFFYKRLTTKPKTLRKNDPENDPKLSPAEKRHLRVKGWTKQVNLFEKDFIIVPINEHSHWFLAIICFPGLTGPVRFSDNTPVEPEEVTPKKNSPTLQIGNTTITHIIKADGSTISLEVDSGSDRDEAEGDQDDLHPSSDDEGSEQVEDESNASTSVQIPLLGPSQPQNAQKDLKSKSPKRKAYKEPIKQPCILIFDSLAGASRVRVVATLRDYLKIEYKSKMGQERDFSKDTIKGAVPKVPQQNNFTDCGLYVLQYVESFFQDPLHDFKLPLKYLQDWFPEEVVSCKRQKLASLIKGLMEEQGIKVEEMGLPALTFANGSNTRDDQSRMEDEEMDEEEINEEEEEVLRRGIQVSTFENEDEDMNAEDEETNEEDEEDEDEEFDEDDEDEELELGEIPRQWLSRASGSCKKVDPSFRRSKPLVYSTNALVEYDPSENEEDGENVHEKSISEDKDEICDSVKVSVEKQYCIVEQNLVPENKKSVPLTEYQDFESQISCTTIERNFEGKTSESDMIVNESEEVVEDECRGAADEEETSFNTSGSGSINSVTDNFNQSLEKKTFRANSVYVKDDSEIEVSDIIKKLVNEKNITISRKEDEINSSLFRKHLDMKKFKVKDCDKGEEVKKTTCPSPPPKANIATYKRSFQALKSVRIPKKTDRNLELCSKRQKVDET